MPALSRGDGALTIMSKASYMRADDSRMNAENKIAKPLLNPTHPMVIYLALSADLTITEPT
jgi:hypothetical protein